MKKIKLLKLLLKPFYKEQLKTQEKIEKSNSILTVRCKRTKQEQKYLASLIF
jgi:hypothetical protein